jgi:hypothetical protein
VHTIVERSCGFVDVISMIIKGYVYVIGSPSYLSGKFGMEYKVDVMLIDNNEATSQACENLFREHLQCQNFQLPDRRCASITSISPISFADIVRNHGGKAKWIIRIQLLHMLDIISRTSVHGNRGKV